MAVKTIRKRPFVTVGLGWFALSIIPMIGIIQTGPQAMADRFTYIPLIGLFISGAWSLREFGRQFPCRWLSPGLCGSTLVCLCCASQLQLQTWSNDSLLWEHCLSI